MTPTLSRLKAICVFACRWCSLHGVERAGRERMALPPQIRLLPVPCAGSISADNIIQAFANGASGVAVLGCHLGGCRHNDANRDAHARLAVLADLLETMGLDRRRLCLSWGTAHEAEQYASLMRSFSAQLEQLPPLPDFFRMPKNQAVALTAAVQQGLGPENPVDDATENAHVRALAAAALDKGRLVLALTPAGDDFLPELFSTKEDLPHLVAGSKYALAKLVGCLLRERAQGGLQEFGPHQGLRERAFGLRTCKLSVACRACDARALRQMADLRQISLQDVEFLPLPCSLNQQRACACHRPQWPSDTSLLIQPEKGSEEVQKRIDWPEQLSRCVQCHRCRTACPVCVCPACSLDQMPALSYGSAPAASPLAYHMTRALHVADVCVQCGACQDACPQGIPLLRLHQSVASSLANLGYCSGEGMASPLRRQRLQLAAPQWQDSLKGGTSA